MKGYRTPVIIFGVLFILYVIAALNKPQPIDWTVTLNNKDKNPYGGYIIYNQLKNIFSGSTIHTYQTPLYNQLNNINIQKTAYIVLAPSFSPSKNDMEEMHKYVRQGNYVFIAANNFSKLFLNNFKLKTASRISLVNQDSTSVNFVNPALQTKNNYKFYSATIDEYFSGFDTAKTMILGINDRRQPNFIKIISGSGAYFIHAAPVCFSNYFMLFANNAMYTSNALSYIPKNVSFIYWDQYYKPGNTFPETPLRFFLQNEYLNMALLLALSGLLIYVLFEMKRKQRIIPTISPLTNTTLDFVHTVAAVYYNQKDNKGIATKKINFFMDYIRQKFFMPTSNLDMGFTEQLSRKSGINQQQVVSLVSLINEVQAGNYSDTVLIKLDAAIDHFYKQV